MFLKVGKGAESQQGVPTRICAMSSMIVGGLIALDSRLLISYMLQDDMGSYHASDLLICHGPRSIRLRNFW